MRRMRRVYLVGLVLAVGACATQQPVVHPARPYGQYQQKDPLRQTATDASSVESIVSSLARVGRLVAGSGY